MIGAARGPILQGIWLPAGSRTRRTGHAAWSSSSTATRTVRSRRTSSPARPSTSIAWTRMATGSSPRTTLRRRLRAAAIATAARVQAKESARRRRRHRGSRRSPTSTNAANPHSPIPRVASMVDRMVTLTGPATTADEDATPSVAGAGDSPHPVIASAIPRTQRGNGGFLMPETIQRNQDRRKTSHAEGTLAGSLQGALFPIHSLTTASGLPGDRSPATWRHQPARQVCPPRPLPGQGRHR